MGFRKKKITLDQQAGKESSQILLEGDVIVPDNKPDIEQILRCSGIVQLQEAKGNEDRVNFSGELLLSILYQGKKVSNQSTVWKRPFLLKTLYILMV